MKKAFHIVDGVTGRILVTSWSFETAEQHMSPGRSMILADVDISNPPDPMAIINGLTLCDLWIENYRLAIAFRRE